MTGEIEVPYVGGPFAGGVDPTGFMDAIEIRRGGRHESGKYVLSTGESGAKVYRWEPEPATGRPSPQ
ncbi:hypothetical protein ABZ468_08165 [Streptomyces sp. NPDC005708]|uniref:hypothetical protein n=1 Tax=Streptomyces sp. NPDC005708 TaxID=3154564 RepID=UPI0033E50B52